MKSTEDRAQRLKMLEEQMSEPSFWSDKDTAQKLLKEYQELKLARDGGSAHERGGALLTIVAGAGGDDAEDFARILLEMYQKYAAQKSWSMQHLSDTRNSLGGYRNVSYEIEGKNVYGALRGEAGVHRLVRMSPFNAAGKRQTSFCLVEVLPIVEDTGDSHIPEKEVELTFARSGGPGGQNVNKRDTAVRATHIPTGLSVHVTSERSQHANKEKALEMLRGKLFALKEAQAHAASRGLSTGAHTKIEWGSQIRSYVLHPYQLVKDHRTNHERRDIDAVFGGDIQSFIDEEKSLDNSTDTV